MSEYLDAGSLVYLATFFYALGFLFKNQIVLRLFVLTGTAVYIIYYSNVSEQPLWEAIIGSVIIGFANLIGFGSLLFDKIPYFKDAKHKEFFYLLEDEYGRSFTPGNFRRLMKYATFETLNEPKRLATQGQTPDILSFILAGPITAIKSGKTFDLQPNIFIGEISFLLGVPASATVDIKKNARLVTWPKAMLKKQFEAKPSLLRDFEVLISKDMARKVAKSHQASEPALFSPNPAG